MKLVGVCHEVVHPSEKVHFVLVDHCSMRMSLGWPIPFLLNFLPCTSLEVILEQILKNIGSIVVIPSINV
jgi:hypothetical protein